MGRTLMWIGGVLLAIGAVLALTERFFPGIGRLPGDLVIRRGNFTLYFPLATSLLLSLGLTLLLWIVQRLGR